ncbi:unnamed protein product [Trichogramma brassicae]|uniref:Uncharacterized protein n=1 Tax=Trichogramma brassicae TaxID=86971 RepID=A0A6H5IYA7_9HYME|nr:unnamed protein product [Trichogramma brassicae]
MYEGTVSQRLKHYYRRYTQHSAEGHEVHENLRQSAAAALILLHDEDGQMRSERSISTSRGALRLSGGLYAATAMISYIANEEK